MLTGRQFARYEAEWKSLCLLKKWDPKNKAAQEEFHRGLGLPASRRDWNTSSHFDRFLAACKEARGIPTGGQKRTDEDGERRRLVWRIKSDAQKAGLAPAYIIECARDLHVLGNWEDLDLESLTNLRDTIHNRAGKKLRKDTRNVRTSPVRRYDLDPVPRMFTPRPVAAPATPRGTSPALVIDDNEPF